jgi:hypothetical protein
MLAAKGASGNPLEDVDPSHILTTNASAGDTLQVNADGYAQWASTVPPTEIALASAHLLIGQDTGVAADTAVTGDVTITKGGVTAIGAAKVLLAMLGADTVAWLDQLRTYLADGMLQIGTLLIDAVPEKFKTTTTLIYTIAGLPYTKAATTALVFSAANGTINLAGAAGTGHWGVFLVQTNAAGTVTTKPGTYTSGTDQDYATEALAIAVLPSVTAANVQIGYITVQVKTGGLSWTPTVDDLTPGSDVTAANFYNLPAAKTLPAAL